VSESKRRSLHLATDVPPDDTPGDGVLLVPERLAVRIGDREAVLTRTQFRLLGALLATPGHTLSRAALIEAGIGDLVCPRTVDVHIKEIRRKLGPDAWRVETVRGRGYRCLSARPDAGGS
jgi:DNA-binding response OmpR family regulator